MKKLLLYFVLLLALAAPAFAANEIKTADATGKTLYALIWNPGQTQVLTVSGLTFGAYSAGSLSAYAVTMTESGTAAAVYAGTFPALSSGRYPVYVYEEASSGTVGGPGVDTLIAADVVNWTGTAVVGTLDTYTQASGANTQSTANGAAIAANTTAIGLLPSASTIAAADAAVVWAATTRTLTALPNVTVGGYATGQDPATLLFAGSYLTIPGSHTTTGVGETLTFKQEMALLDALPGGDNVQTTPVKSGAATVTYYLRGAAHTSANIVAVSTVTYDAIGNQVTRTVLTAQPFPTF